MDWFSVDKEGLARLVADRPKIWILHELLSNAFDEDGVTYIAVDLQAVPGRPLAKLEIHDNSPNGFRNLTDAWTMFAESYKKGEASKRGRFNIGEKLVLALCDEASIITTTGTVYFDAEGRRRGTGKTDKGTIFKALIRITREELADVERDIDRVIVPSGIEVNFNGRTLAKRKPFVGFTATLPTVVADDEGVLRRAERITCVDVYEPLPGERASLYEMGIPVVETGDTFHVNVGQKVPLNSDRDNVTPSFLRAIRVAVVNYTADRMTPERATSTEVQEATSDPRCEPQAVGAMLTNRFGEKRYTVDPSDPEANLRLTQQGYTPIHGGSLTPGQWERVKTTNLSQPAGVICPSPKPYTQNGRSENVIPHERWTPMMKQVSEFIIMLVDHVLGKQIAVQMVREPQVAWAANYGPGGPLTLNVSRLGQNFFGEFPANLDKVLRLVTHELGHEFGTHLTDEFEDGMCQVAAKTVILALTQPRLFPTPPVVPSGGTKP